MGPSSGAPTPPNTIRAPPIGPCGTPKRRRYFANRLPLPAGVSKLILQRGPKPPKVLSNEVPNDPLIFQQCPKPRKWFSNSSQNHESGFPTVLKIPTKHKGLAFQRLQLCTDVFSNAYSPSAFANLLRDLGPRRATPPAPTGIQNKPPAQPCTETPKSSIRKTNYMFGALSGLGPCPGWGPYGPMWALMGPYMGPYGSLWAPYKPSWTGLGGLGRFRILSVNFP